MQVKDKMEQRQNAKSEERQEEKKKNWKSAKTNKNDKNIFYVQKTTKIGKEESC